MNKALLTQQGHNLFCISRNKKALEELRDECSRLYPGAGINILGFDVTQAVNDSDILPASIKKLFPRVDVLLNNAVGSLYGR